MRTPLLPDDGLILIDIGSSKPLAMDDGGTALLKVYNDARGELCSMPDEIVKALSTLPTSDIAHLRMPLRIGREKYLCRAYVLADVDHSSAQSMVAIHLQRSSSSVDAVDELAATYDLTQREQEALLGIAAGLTCKEVAGRMNISPNTVKAYLRLIMIKLGVTRRAGIMSKLLEQTAGTHNVGARQVSQRGFANSPESMKQHVNDGGTEFQQKQGPLRWRS